MGSEAKQRSVSKELIGPNIKSEVAAFTFKIASGGEEIRKAPIAYVPDLVGKVKQLLDQNDRYLPQHNSKH